ncbi:MAG: DEAD/DEAH box helicase family protein [Acidobacteria bacterium]|nr:DEAD/DEAH box helicase family protein [Acidobacteriota bacterium]
MATRVPQVRRGEIVRIRGERWRIAGQAGCGDAAIVDAIGCDATNRAQHARFVLPCEPFDRLNAPTAPRLVGAARWRHVARRTLADALPSWWSLRSAARANLTLIPFQLEPALALVRGAACRFLIADAVGLGKTVEAGLMIAETLQRVPDARALVVSPAGLREQWQDELSHRFGLDADIFDAAGLARASARLPAGMNPWALAPLVITSVDYIKRPEVIRSLETITWDVVVLDEAHHLAGRSDRAGAANLLGDRARALVLLTATPHSGDDEAFARLCGLGNPGGRDALAVFRRTRADAGLAGSRRASLLRIRPTPQEAAMHAALMAYARAIWAAAADATHAGARLAASVLTRRACSSAGSLARSIERRLALLGDDQAPTGAQGDLPFDEADSDDEPGRLLRAPGLRDRGDECGRLARLLALAREAAASESKLAALRRLLSRIDEPAIVFTEYRDTLQRIAETLPDVELVQLHGGLTSRERADAVRRFTRGSARVLLATDAGSEGLNLHQRCRLAVNLELPWTPLRVEQRVGRVDRIGQPRRVHAVHFVAAGTCEERTLAGLLRRAGRASGAMTLLARLPDEPQVADAILGRRPDALLPGEAPALPDGLVTPDLRREAIEEARRMTQARALAAAGSDATDPARPVISCVHRRRYITTPRCLWVYRVALVTAAGRLMCDALVPFGARIGGRPFRSADTIRGLLDPGLAALQAPLASGRDRLLADVRQTLGPALRRWIERESDLAAALRGRHARLSAGLLQRGLFDARDERLEAAQASLLAEALSRSADRLRDLEQAADLRIDSCELAFGVLLV